MKKLLFNLWLCIFAVFFTSYVAAWLAWQVLVSYWDWLVFRFNYGWKAKLEKWKWL